MITASIEPLAWVAAHAVLPDEAHDFTPWLATHLDMLAPVLGLDSLELVQAEYPVGSFRLDIRAIGSDPDGEIGVVIEN